MPRRRSPVFEHFTCFKDAQGNDKAQCKHCGLQLGANTKNGTSNLRTHVRICKARDGESSHPTSSPLPLPLPQLLELQPSGPGESSDREPAGLDKDEASRDLARMIALHGYDPSVVEDDYFRSFVRRLNPQFEVPSREAIEKMCAGIFRDSWKVLDFSNVYGSGKASLAVGEVKAIQSLQTGQVVYVTSHSIDGHWNLHRVVEHVCVALPVGGYYHVPLLRVPMVALDDAVDHITGYIAYEDQLASSYEFDLFMVAGEMTGHINHLELKNCMEQKRENKIYYSSTFIDHVLHSIARCLLPDPCFANSIFDSVDDYLISLRGTHQELLTQLGLAKLGLLDDPWEYGESWYSCYCCLEIHAQAVPPNSGSYTKQLLHTLWREIYRAIKTVSDSNRPTSNLCLQVLFKVRDVLQSQLSKAPDGAHADNYSGFGNKSVSDVLSEALETVDKAIQDSYLVWSIPLVLDPRYKLRYIKDKFEGAFVSEAEKYVSEVRRKTKELYISYIEAGDEGDSGGIIEVEDMAVDSSNTASAQAWDELDGYLQDSPARQTEGFDILNWWKVHGSVQYPTVARMARDALAMPTCSKLTSDQIAFIKSMLRGYNCWWR
ncbi:unnamed protein product [Urochloa decumbens]